MAEIVTSLIKENAVLIGNNLRQFYLVLKGPGQFIASLKPPYSDHFLPASIFAVLVSLSILVLNIPVSRILHVEVENVSYIVVDTILSFAFFFIYGSIFHLSAKLFRGQGDYAGSLVSYLYLTVFFVVLAAVSIPQVMLTKRLILLGTDTTTAAFDDSLISMLKGSTAAQFSVLAGLLIWAWYFVSLTKVVRVVHGVGVLRGASIVLVGFAAFLFIVDKIETPTVQMLMLAYQKMSS
jgi:hypothetical protein